MVDPIPYTESLIPSNMKYLMILIHNLIGNNPIIYGCNSWQLLCEILRQYYERKYNITNMYLMYENKNYFNKNQSEIQQDYKNINFIYHNCYNKEYIQNIQLQTFVNKLQTFVSFNSVKYVTQIFGLNDLNMKESVIYKLCLYDPNTYNDFVNDYGVIKHFFSVFLYNNKIFITSSYGSDNVCIPPYTTEGIEFNIFNTFCALLQKDVKSRTRRDQTHIESYIKDFFLKNGKNVLEKEAEDEDYNFKSAVKADIGKLKESKIYKTIQIYIGWFKEYDTYVTNAIDIVLPPIKKGGKHSKNKRHTIRRKHKKRRTIRK